MGVAVGMQPPWGLAATAIVILVAHITGNVALRVDPGTEEFPLLMPRVHPHQAESYLCTPIRVDTDVTYSITGFRPNATKMTAPAHSTTYFETACEIEDQRQIHPFAFRTHTHSLGRVVSGWRVRNNQDW